MPNSTGRKLKPNTVAKSPEVQRLRAFLFFQRFNELPQVNPATQSLLKISPGQLDRGEPIAAIRTLSPPQNGGGARPGVYAAHVGPFAFGAYHNLPPLFGEQGQTSGPSKPVDGHIPQGLPFFLLTLLRLCVRCKYKLTVLRAEGLSRVLAAQDHPRREAVHDAPVKEDGPVIPLRHILWVKTCEPSTQVLLALLAPWRCPFQRWAR